MPRLPTDAAKLRALAEKTGIALSRLQLAAAGKLELSIPEKKNLQEKLTIGEGDVQ